MNRRSFFKAVTGFVAGMVASTKKSKDLCGGQNGTLCPRCKYNGESSTGTVLNSKNLLLLNRMERLRIESAEGYKRYYVHYDFGTKVQTLIEDGKITETRKFKEDPFVLFNPDPKVNCVIFERYKLV